MGWGAGLPLLAAAALLSKPLPSAPVVAGVGVWLIARAVRGDRRSLAIPAGSAAAIVAPALAAVVLLKMPADEILYYGFRLPSDDMGVRVANISTWVGLRGRHARIWPQIGQHSPALVHLAGLAVLAAWCWTRRSRVRADVLRAAGLWVLAECLFLVTLLFVYLTNNQPRNGLAFQPVATGLAHMAALVWLSACRAERVRIALALAISTPFVVVGTLDAWRFNSEVNAVRSVHDQLWTSESPPVAVPAPLAFMRLNEAWNWRGFVDILPTLQKRSDNFLLIGDSTILYGASGKPSVLPVPWIHVGLTMPHPNAPEYHALERRLEQNVRRYDVRFVVLEGASAWTGISLASFPTIQALVDGCPTSTLGIWRILEICH